MSQDIHNGTDEAPQREPFLDICPKRGWLADYLSYTSWSEAPAVFHFFVGCTVLGAAIMRRAWFNKGYYSLYPSHRIILVAPTGKCRKTTALSLGIALLRELDLNIISDKITPEALATALSAVSVTEGSILATKDAQGVLYAPELAVFLGKQKYNEGLIALLTALFDDPDQWSTQTKGGGKVELRNVCLAFFGASTPDWLITAIPQDAFGGGFMSRLLYVVQEDTPRCFPIPKPTKRPETLLSFLKDLRKTDLGEIGFDSQDSKRFFDLWYAASKRNIPEDEKMAGYHERKPDHLLKLSMILAISEGRRAVSIADMTMAGKILLFLEASMLTTFKWLGVRPIGVDQERILRIVKANDGVIRTADLLRKLIFYMNAQQFRGALETLEQSGLIRKEVDLKSKVDIVRLIKEV
jgi:hypothetical protein